MGSSPSTAFLPLCLSLCLTTTFIFCLYQYFPQSLHLSPPSIILDLAQEYTGCLWKCWKTKQNPKLPLTVESANKLRFSLYSHLSMVIWMSVVKTFFGFLFVILPFDCKPLRELTERRGDMEQRAGKEAVFYQGVKTTVSKSNELVVDNRASNINAAAK